MSTGFFTEARTGIPNSRQFGLERSCSIPGLRRPSVSRVSLRATPQDPPMVRIATRLPPMGGRSMRACPKGSRSSMVGRKEDVGLGKGAFIDVINAGQCAGVAFGRPRGRSRSAGLIHHDGLGPGDIPGQLQESFSFLDGLHIHQNSLHLGVPSQMLQEIRGGQIGFVSRMDEFSHTHPLEKGVAQEVINGIASLTNGGKLAFDQMLFRRSGAVELRLQVECTAHVRTQKTHPVRVGKGHQFLFLFLSILNGFSVTGGNNGDPFYSLSGRTLQ